MPIFGNDCLYRQNAELYYYNPIKDRTLNDAAYTVLRLLEQAHSNYQAAPQELKENYVFEKGFLTVVGFTDFLWYGIVQCFKPVSIDGDRWYALDKYTRFLRFSIAECFEPILIIDRRLQLYGACYTMRAFQFDTTTHDYDLTTTSG
jgi:hypothetical protein